MPEDQTAALTALSQAMDIEQEGIDFYSRAAGAAQDERAGQALRRLAREEKNHFNLLKRQYEALSREGLWQDIPELKTAPPPSAGRNFFPKLEKPSSQAPLLGASITEVLLFGMEIETRSYNLYSRAASSTDDPKGQAMYQFLVAEEMRHFDLLMTEYEHVTGPAGWQY